MESSVTWKSGMAFEVALDGHRFTLDAAPGDGGQDLGPRPKGLVLSALAGCTGMDVISILTKMRQKVTGLRVSADGDTTEEHPRRFTTIRVRYEIEGEGLDLDKVRRAVQLSEERYCGVSATLRPSVEIRPEILVNGERIDQP